MVSYHHCVRMYGITKGFYLYHVLWRAKESPDTVGKGQHSALQNYTEATKMLQYNNH